MSAELELLAEDTARSLFAVGSAITPPTLFAVRGVEVVGARTFTADIPGEHNINAWLTTAGRQLADSGITRAFFVAEAPMCPDEASEERLALLLIIYRRNEDGISFYIPIEAGFIGRKLAAKPIYSPAALDIFPDRILNAPWLN